MRREKGMNWKKNIYVYLEIPWLLQVPSFALCLFVFPRFIHLTEQSARWSSQPHRFLSFFNSFHPLRLSPSTRRASLRLIDFLRPDGVRGYDSNGCSFSHLSPLAHRSIHDSIVISPPPSFLSPSAVISNFLLSSFESCNDDDENEVNGWRRRGAREAGNVDGRGA